jgi:hypothetical protein
VAMWAVRLMVVGISVFWAVKVVWRLRGARIGVS